MEQPLPIAAIAAGISIKIGAELIAKGLQVVLPELGKLVNLPELSELSRKIEPEPIVNSTLEILQKI